MDRRKRQRLSRDGQDAVTAYGDDAVPQVEGNTSPTVKTKTVFVHSLPADATTESLTDFFSQTFPIKHAIVVIDPSTKTSKGYGFVTFADFEDAQHAKDTLNGSIYQGRKIGIDLAEPRHRAPCGNHTHGNDFIHEGAKKRQRELNRSENQKPPKLIVRNLPWSINESDQLAVLFRSFGKVKYATLPKKPSGLSPGYGFVTLRGEKNAQKAVREMNGKEVDGRQLAVDFAVDKAVWQTVQKRGIDKMIDPGLLEAPDEDTSVKSEDVDIDSINAASGEDEETHNLDTQESLLSSDDEVDKNYKQGESSDNSTTLFVRNVPFDVTDDMIVEHFTSFGPVRYSRVVVDPLTGRSRGTAFVCFYNTEDAKNCLRKAPRVQAQPFQAMTGTAITAATPKRSLLENSGTDLSGYYTLHDRVLQISQAVDRGEAKRLTSAGSSLRESINKDKRRLYLLSEGTVSASSPLYDQLSPSELKIREESAKQRQALIKSNPALHLSLTRLSVRNLPRTMTSKELKEFARKAVVGFASDVKAGIRRPLSKEELARGGEEMKQADRDRKAKGKGIVRQAKIVFEGLEGGKVSEDSGGGRSRGYGFIEYTSHRSALMGLRWLNGHPIETRTSSGDEQDNDRRSSRGKKKRLIIEFAIENAQVVGRRREREAKARERSRMFSTGDSKKNVVHYSPSSKEWSKQESKGSRRFKGASAGSLQSSPSTPEAVGKGNKLAATGKLSKRQQIIARKRKLRRSKRTGSVH
ncbi:MAG: hypothetical protein Q9195_002254 [Heterodermia aff. obscurata]